jgi:hypothetical protein
MSTLLNPIPDSVPPAPAASATGPVVRLVERDGVTRIDIGGTVYDPLAFRSFRPTERNISDFYAAGVRLMSVLHTGLLCTLDVPYSPFGEYWKGIGNYDWSVVDRQMDLFIRHAPDARFNIMLQLDTRDWYLRDHPECSNTFWNLVEMAGHEPWLRDTARFVQDSIRYFEERYGDRIFAYTLMCGSSTEWYTNSQGRGRPEAALRPHPLKTECLRAYTGAPAAEMPSLEELHAAARGSLRDPVADARAIQYWRFHHGVIGDAILHFSRCSQEALKHRKLLGVFYGYLTQLNGPRLLNEGHLAYERVWASPDLDMIFAPAKYGEPRSFGGASGFLETVDSLRLHGKLVFQEIDHTTFIAPKTVENGRGIPGSDSKLPDLFSTVQVLRREFALTRVKRVALWWFDFFGRYYEHPELMAEIANQVGIEARLRSVPLESAAEIAVFGDVESMYYAAAQSPLAQELLVTQPDALARLGAPYDIFNLSDLDHPALDLSRYKLVVLLNAYQLPPARLAALRRRVQSGGRHVLWFHAPNVIQDTFAGAAGASEAMGINVRLQAATGDSVRVAAEDVFSRLTVEARFGFSAPVAPLFAGHDPAAVVHGVFASDGAPALLSKRLAEHTAWFSAVGNMPATVWREIARAAGVHVYSEGTDPLYVASSLIGVHQQGEVAPTLTLPHGRPVRLQELFTRDEDHAVEGSITLPDRPGHMRLYLLS